MPTTTDTIHKQIVLRAPRSRVWRALTDTAEFGAWFGVRIEGEFKPKARLVMQGTTKGCGHPDMRVDILIERVEPERLFSYRWHPGAVDPKIDYSREPLTLVEFQLEELAEGTRLTVVESGFDRLPPERRDTALRMNDGGWNSQIKNIEQHVSAG